MDNNPRIIHAPINGRRYAVTSPITQYDYGYLLLPEGTELPATYEIDFSNDEHKGTSLPVYGDSEGAEVPEELIRTGKDVFAFYYRVGEGYGKTEFTWRIPNHCRPSRDGETPTPSQQSSIDQLIVRSNEAVTSAEQSASDASASAQESAESARASANSAVQASLSESNAERAKGNAQASAESASASATASAQSASEAETARQATTSLVAEAQGYANASEQSATASANSAEQAESAKGVAQSYAQDAQTSATYASVSESTANAKAQEASGYAQTASAKATESAQSASQASGYAQTAESAKTDAQTAQGKAEDAQTAAETAQGKAEDAQEAAETTAASIQSSAAQIAQNEADILKAFPTDSASGAIASFPDGADGIPLKSLVVDIDPVQDLSNGDPSPENICPISGWTGCEVNASGKNFLALPVIRFSEETATVNDCFYLKQGTYTLSYSCADTHRLGIRMMDANGTIYTDYSDAPILGFAYNSSAKCYYAEANIASGSKTYTLTIKHDCYVRIVSNLIGGGFTDAQLELGSSATAYEPYNGTTLTINWQTEAGTVYGGKLDVLSGVLRVEWAYIDLASLSGWVNNMSGQNAIEIRCTLTGKKGGRTNIISNLLKTGTEMSATDSAVFSVRGYPTTSVIAVKVPKTVAQDSSEVVTWIANNHPMACYELAEPIEIQLDAHTLNSLYGQNNIWADLAGDTEVEYRADTKLYINRLTEPDADMIADANIVSGQYFMVGNNLYRATVNIASGAQVIEGTNATKVSLSEALNQIKEA